MIGFPEVLQVSQYYVYVYIDPRNFEEFYFGKGKGSRKEDDPRTFFER